MVSCKQKLIISEVSLLTGFILCLIPILLKKIIGYEIKSRLFLWIYRFIVTLFIYIIVSMLCILPTFGILKWYAATIASISIPIWIIAFVIRVERMRESTNWTKCIWVFITMGILIPAIFFFTLFTENICIL